MLHIRQARPTDSDVIWSILQPVFRAGETYTIPRDIAQAEALSYWFSAGNQVFVAEEDGNVLGTYYLRPNQRGGGSHVCNCGYITAAHSTGRGVARQMCLHSKEEAQNDGYLAMQFNFVVSTNERAIKLWQSLGFEIVGRLPSAFEHPTIGFVDALVMFAPL
jgi:ribosomal protein S18 acetylase RimI-like enzyme